MRISRIFEAFAKSKPGQKLYKWACEPKSEQFLNNTLPTIETAVSTAIYIASTERQKNLDRDEKNLLQIQNVASGVVGIGIGSWANRKISNVTEEIIKGIDTTKLDPKSLRKVSTGLRIATPILTTGILMRFMLPTFIAAFSGKWMDKVREKRQQNPTQKLDVKV